MPNSNCTSHSIGKQKYDSIEYYYISPNVDIAELFSTYLHQLDRTQEPKAGIAYFSQIFTANEAKLFDFSSRLDLSTSLAIEIFFGALWQSKSTIAHGILHEFSLSEDSDFRKIAAKTYKSKLVNYDKTSINSIEILNQLWLCFCATGNKYFIHRIFLVALKQNPFPDSSLAKTAHDLLNEKISRHELIQTTAKALLKSLCPAQRNLLSTMLTTQVKVKEFSLFKNNDQSNNHSPSTLTLTI